jgi:hypothetical protein
MAACKFARMLLFRRNLKPASTSQPVASPRRCAQLSLAHPAFRRTASVALRCPTWRLTVIVNELRRSSLRVVLLTISSLVLHIKANALYPAEAYILTAITHKP